MAESFKNTESDAGQGTQTTMRVSERLFQKRVIQPPSTLVFASTSSATEDGISPAAKKMRRYREKLKEKGEYKQYCERQAQLAKARANQSEEKKKEEREKTRLRVQKCREKKKTLGEPLNRKPPQTRSAMEVARTKEGERKRKYRAGLTPQKKVAVNAKRRRQAAEKRQQQAQATEQQAQATEQQAQATEQQAQATEQQQAQATEQQAQATEQQQAPATEQHMGQQQQATEQPMQSFHGYSKKSTRAKALSRAKSKMPHSPHKYAEVAEQLLNTKSPRKKAALERKGLAPSNLRIGITARENYHRDMLRAFEEDNKSRKTTTLKSKSAYCRFFLKSNPGMKLADFRRELNVSWRYLQKLMINLDKPDKPARKKRSDALSPETEQSIKDFFSRGDISREEPSARNVSAKDGEPRRYMCKTLKEAWQQYLVETSTRISYSKFCKYRPKTTKTVDKDTFKTCCCEYCENVTLKRKAINPILQANGFGDRLLGTKYRIVDMTCCPPDQNLGLHKKACIDRKCPDCGVEKFHKAMDPMLQSIKDKPCIWQEWKSMLQTYTNKKGEEVTGNKLTLAKMEGTFGQLIEALEKDLQTFAWHMANFQWQQQQFDHLVRDVPEGYLVMVMDFGENFTCHYQDEAQGAHWTRKQVTVHPVVTFYRCPDHPDDISQETFCFISNDLRHDCHAVQHFQLEVLRSLLDRGLDIKKVIHFSDGAPSQYKGKTNFVDVSFAEEDTGIPTEKHFFGSRHGKGPCDREIGVVKRMARLAVLRRKCVIANAQDLYDYGCSYLTKPGDGSHSHMMRQFRFVGEGTINRERPDRTEGKSIPGTRKLHCVRGLSPFDIMNQKRSCFCKACVTGEGNCPNSAFVGAWKKVSLKVKRRKEATAPATENVPLDDDGQVETTAEGHAQPGAALPGDESSALNSRNPKVDDFVKAVFQCTSGRRQTGRLFYAKVLDIADDGADCHLHYMVERDGAWEWADKAWHPVKMIQEIVKPPTLLPGRKLTFKFQ